ncbi:DUF4142 domain-containing protein [Telluribacter sp.]|jgi:putative membrane protein|uniref:DUF4142 domain-containing protein n=1 Tax=Telluribacter sp. TaxID=1978767 RepID=UPI002E11EDFF|nr:DUF4142 domain-containing protein [Telluribacter sp.]
MRKLKWNLLLLAGMFVAVSCNNDDDNDDNMVAEVDRQFAMTAAEANLLGIRTGQLVQNNTKTQSVRDYNTTMTTYYNTATNDLATLAQRRNISLPTTLGTMNQRDYDRLASYQGMQFDTAYANWAVRSNQRSIDALRAHMSATNDTEFRDWINTRLSTLEQNQMAAQKLQQSFKTTTTPTTTTSN